MPASCPPGKVRNPATGRCKTVKAPKKAPKAKTAKNNGCPADKVKVPRVDCCVGKRSAVAKKLGLA